MVHVGLPRKVETLKQCNSTLFSQLYEALTGSRVPGLALQAPTSEAVKCQAVVDALNVHLFPHVTLDHIRGIEVAQLDPLSIKNLLDVFSVLFHVPPPASSDGEGGSKDGAHHYYSDNSDNELENGKEADDSNVISSEGMSVISEVLREELGHSSRSAVTDSTTELVKPVPAARLPTRLLTTVPATRQEQTRRDVWCSGENYSVVSQSNESSATNSKPASLTISSLHTTSTEEESGYHERAIPQARGAPQDAVTADGTNRQQDKADASSRVTGAKAPILGFVPLSGESSVGTTPSPKLCTPPQSPRQHHSISPLHHSTPHTSTRSRLFPFSSSTSTAISSHTPLAQSHPLSTSTVTPSVAITHKQISQLEKRPSNWREGEKLRPIQEQDTQSTLVTEENTLVPESPTSPRAYPQQISITDLHTTTMSSGGGGASEQVGGALKTAVVDAQHSFSEDSYSTCSETPPEQRSPQKVAHPLPLTPKPSSVRTAAAAQRVCFSQSAEQTEKARHGDSLTMTSSDHSSNKVGELSSVQLNLGVNTQSRASVLATLYQNYLSDLKTANPVTETTRKPRANSKSRLMTKVH